MEVEALSTGSGQISLDPQNEWGKLNCDIISTPIYGMQRCVDSLHGDFMGVVVAFSGPIGAGKSTISKRVADSLNWPRVSFGEYIKKVARENGEDPEDRAVLQRLGQALVLADVDGLVEEVLSQCQWKDANGEGNLVVDGLRHAEVRHALVQRIRPNILKHVFVTIDEDTRQQRVRDEDHIEPRILMRYDQDITEAQIPRILREYRDIDVNGRLPTQIAAREVVAKLNLTPTPSPREAAE
jgi:cytidylate kinase